MFKRLIVNQDTGERIIGFMRFWDIAGLAGTLCSFFEDVDFLPFDRPGVGFLMATGPRKTRSEGIVCCHVLLAMEFQLNPPYHGYK